jgi:nucleotide-binding universal stress UspA family protein
VIIGPSNAQRRDLEDELAEEIALCRRCSSALVVHGAVHDGAPWARLVDHADLVDANVLVVGNSDTGRMTRLLFGSTGAHLLRTARHPVVVVREPTPVQEACVATGYAPVVAAVDDCATSTRVLEFAFDVAERRGAGVLVVYAGAGSAAVARNLPLAAFRMQLAGVRRQHPEVGFRVETAADHMARTVLGHSTEARLVVVGDRKARSLARFLSRSILHRARCSVAVLS